MIKVNRFNLFLLAALLLSFAGGILCEYLYHSSSQNPVDMKGFREELTLKQQKAIRTLTKLKRVIVYNSIDSLFDYRFEDKDISYYLIDKGQLIYWSANYTDLVDLPLTKQWKWHYIATTNAHAIACYTETKAGRLVAVVRIKNNYPFENNQLKNKFSEGFSVDSRVEVVAGNPTDKLAVADKWGNYLFSLQLPGAEILNKQTGTIGFVFELVCFLLLLIVLSRYHFFRGQKSISLGRFLLVVAVTLVLLGLSLYYQVPDLLYAEQFSTAFDYSSGTFLESIIHLTLLTLYAFSIVFLFFSRVNILPYKKLTATFLLQLVTALFYVLIFFILKGLVLHSGMPINILSLRDVEGGVIWLHFLMLIWGVSLALLFFKTHNHCYKAIGLRKMLLADGVILVVFAVILWFTNLTDFSRVLLFCLFLYAGFYLRYFLHSKLNIYVLAFIWIFFFTLFFVENTVMISNHKAENKYRVLAENILINGNADNDRVAEIMLEELDYQISHDRLLGKFIQHPDSTEQITNYFNENYLRGFWNKYDVQLAVAEPGSILYGQNRNLIESSGIQLRRTHFYSFGSTFNDMAYMGLFPEVNVTGDSVYLFLSFFPRKNFRSYSFPTFLISSESDIQSRLNIAVARYRNNQLVYERGGFEFPQQNGFVPGRVNLFYKVSVGEQRYFVYQPDAANCIVIAELNRYSWLNYLIYFAYTLLANLAILMFAIWLYNRKRRKLQPKSSLSSRYQLAFVILLLVSFVGIFYVSVTFITSKYKDQQISEIEKKKSYIQNALQEKYYWTQDLSTVSSQGLNFDLQELSYMYQTDINVYDNYGRLVGSSQPLIYNKNLVGRQIAPEPFFGDNPTINQEEYIGELRFLTGYADFYNGDYLQIGYISIPLYVSNEEIRNEIEDFLAVVVHIYLIIALLSVLLSFFIGKQLSAPLKMIENKLKKMRFGQRNEKIDYSVNDEIGQLVNQYNKTIEELEKSARLLAQTERESAWRTMARQIAHEINNPLTPMKLTIQQLQRTKRMNDERFDDYFDKSTETLVEQIDNLSRIAGTFSNFARMPEARFERFDIAARLHSTVLLFVANNENVQLNYIGNTENVFVLADPEQMLQVFNNLLKNAIQSIPADRNGNIDVTLTHEDKVIRISVADNGKGIPPELQDKVFIPNFTTKTTGMGLGLSITKNIVEMAGGTITFSTNESKGSVFVITLPVDN